MTVTANNVIGLLLLVWLLAACGGNDSATIDAGGDESVATQDDEDSTSARASSGEFSGGDDSSGDAGEPSDEIASGAVADGSTPLFGQVINAEEILPLQGTAWLIDEIDSEPHTGAISFAWRQGEGLVSWFRDECTTGGFTTSTAVRDGWLVINDEPPPNCSSPLSSIFSDGGIVEIDLVEDDTLTIASPGGEFTASHWQSVSVHDEPVVVEFE